jgi:Domain of unknown function (DUF4331)
MSDHFSGPRALAGPAGDITDLYAFPSPQRPGHLTLVMNVRPLAAPDASFSDSIVYRFRLRPLAIEPGTRSFAFGPLESELEFSCAFEVAHPGADGGRPVQRGTVTAPSGAALAFGVDDDAGAHLDGLRVYAGLRSDPFFMDLPAFLESLQAGRLEFKQPGRNFAQDFNVLSIVLEVDCARLTGGPLFGVVGETVVAGQIPIRLERVGRPEIKNVVMFMKQFDQVNRDLEIRDLYNLEDPFHMSRDYRGAYRARLDANLAALDRLDGAADWALAADGRHPLTELLLDDYLVVDASKPFAPDSSFEIERALLEGRPHATCGGRPLNDDIIDKLYTLLIAANRKPIGDGVDAATQPASEVFPYLAPPNANAPTSPQEAGLPS